MLLLLLVPLGARGDEGVDTDVELSPAAILEDRWRLLEIEGVPPPGGAAARLLGAGQPFASRVEEEVVDDQVLRTLYGWIALPREPVDPGAETWLRPAFVARALPRVTGVELLEQEHGCVLLTMRAEHRALRRPQPLRLRLRRCVQQLEDGVRWVARTERVEIEGSGRPSTLPAAFIEVIEIRFDAERGWLLGMSRVELGRRLGRVFASVYTDELRAGLARDLRYAAPVLSGAGALEVERTFRIE